MNQCRSCNWCVVLSCLLLTACTSSRTALRDDSGRSETRVASTEGFPVSDSSDLPTNSVAAESADTRISVSRTTADPTPPADSATDLTGRTDQHALATTDGVQLVSMNADSGLGASQADALSDAAPNSMSIASMTLQLQDEIPNRTGVQFQEVIDSVYRSYPLLQSAMFSRNIALGQQIAASGAFDTKLKGASENGAVGYYETYRQSIGVVTPTYWGGEVFAGYRVGRGSFQPWYQERQTNDAGEFKAGVQIPLARNRSIDDRRAELWKAGYSRNLAEPDIQAQLIGFVMESSYAYWDWVAAGEYNKIAQRILTLAEERTARIEAQVNAGLVDPPELTDNLRLVAIRQAKLADTRRKLQQTAAKLSVYLRDESGNPRLTSETDLPGFPRPRAVSDNELETNIQLALAQRPELRMLDLTRQQISIDYNNARNNLQPEINAVLWGSQDVGERTSKKGDKSPFESEASLYLDVPLQRRKARGKMTEIEGKLAQLSAKRRISADKIRIDVQVAHAALRSAWEQVAETQEALDHAEDLAARERANQEAGASDLLKVTLREQYAVESAEKHIDALKLYYESLADYRAAMALDQVDR